MVMVRPASIGALVRRRGAAVALALALAGCAGGGGGPPNRSFTPLPPDGRCPDRVVRDGDKHGTACLDPVVLGEGRVERCGSYLMTYGWRRDLPVETALRREVGRNFTCYRAPEAAQ